MSADKEAKESEKRKMAKFNVDASILKSGLSAEGKSLLESKGMRVVDAPMPNTWIIQVPQGWEVNARAKWAKNPQTGEEFNLKEVK